MLNKKPTQGELHLMQRERLTDRHKVLLEKIIKENSHKGKYWVLGKAITRRKNGRTSIRPSLKAYDVQPSVEKESYLYEIDNTDGSRKLLWVMHPGDKLSMPYIGKTIRVAAASGDLAAEVTGEINQTGV